MNRRDFARTIAGASLGTLTFARRLQAGPPAPDPKTEPFKLSVMLWTVYRDRPFEERLEKVSEAGYHSVELVEEYAKWSADEFRRANDKKHSLGLTFDTIALTTKGLADPADRDAFLAELKNRLEVAGKLQCPAIIVLSGNKSPGLSHAEQHQNCVEGLKRAADLASKQGVTLLLENIDPEENPKYFLTSVAEGFEIVGEVNQPHVKFLYDFYHEQIAEGNLIEKLEKNISLVGVVHIADVPGRHAPGTGEINYANIFRKLAELNFQGYAAMEFEPGSDVVGELRAARELALRSASQAKTAAS
jgi:hydroxypyruvate isomerase